MRKSALMMFTMVLISTSLPVAAQSLEELARIVREAATTEASINQEREARFVRERDNQRQLLGEARQELANENARSDRLRVEYDQNERTLADLETTLAERMGNLGELFGVVRQASGDVQAALDDSMVTAQLPDRTQFLSELAQRRELPTVPELRALWSAMVTEIAESGRVVKFTAPVERTSGQKEELEVVRLGVFNAVSDGIFLDWDTSKSRKNFIELARQPAARFSGMANDLQEASAGEIVPMSVDFTRGQILRAVVQSKTPIERVREDGGPVGYVIIGVGLFGLLMCLWKAIALFSTGGKITRQMKKEEPDKRNPLGRVLAVYADNPEADIETLELKLDESILRETAPIETGLSFIKVLYVVAPLLGLLGTVVGMIATFQMITLFGTGDPRMMAGGISTALVTTVLGLVVAIPLTLIHSFLQGKAKSLIQVLEEQAAGIIARIAEQRA
ncbi:MAG: MotA/TolQ/ExbB proton channel family protein [Xanthomonadales bacterium]|nr:MotA/TolQ/ExbB proton channel family protein [Gammaproteobacteria bacterium]MBT8052638.1 MotA/TolQ/ExbB proton channel family protein [Gammaproteobacteria bacterium]NND56603.1 MotA/TolQ/ExbB proton channel family protein [Xanthomonadales bacterium]NNK52455.1 MotA/TolQ/ExbB proton channel family protein [Xanthomonadales bacterium]